MDKFSFEDFLNGFKNKDDQQSLTLIKLAGAWMAIADRSAELAERCGKLLEG